MWGEDRKLSGGLGVQSGLRVSILPLSEVFGTISI